MKFLLKLILSAVAVLILAEVLPGVGVDSYINALIVALVLAILNGIVKPVLVFFDPTGYSDHPRVISFSNQCGHYLIGRLFCRGVQC